MRILRIVIVVAFAVAAATTAAPAWATHSDCLRGAMHYCDDRVTAAEASVDAAVEEVRTIARACAGLPASCPVAELDEMVVRPLERALTITPYTCITGQVDPCPQFVRDFDESTFTPLYDYARRDVFDDIDAQLAAASARLDDALAPVDAALVPVLAAADATVAPAWAELERTLGRDLDADVAAAAAAVLQTLATANDAALEAFTRLADEVNAAIAAARDVVWPVAQAVDDAEREAIDLVCYVLFEECPRDP